LNQWLGSLPTKSRTEILPRCGRDYPLPPLINRGSVDDLSEEKIGSKVSQKTSFFPVSAHFFSLSLSTASLAVEDPTKTFLLHQQTTAQPPHEPKSSPATGAAIARSSLSPLQIFFFCFFFFLPPPQVANTATISSTSTSANFTPGQRQQLLLLRKVASHFTLPICSFCNCLVACRT